MAEDKGKISGRDDSKPQPKQSAPPMGAVEAPGFRWVTKGEKGRGIEPAVRNNDGSE